MIEKVDKQTVYSYQYYDKYKQFTKKHLEEALDAYSVYHENLSIINQVAHCYYYLDDYYRGLNFVLKALSLPEEAKLKEEYYYSLKLAGDLYTRLGIFESAAEFYIRAMNYIGHDKDRYKRCDLMQSLAYVYFELCSYDMAIDLAVEALQLAELLDENTLIAKANLSLCRIHQRRKLYDKALKYGLKVIEIHKGNEETKGLIQIYFEMASIYEAMKDYSLSKNFYERALLLAEEAFDEYSSIQANYLLGKMLFSEGHIKRAQKVLEDTADT
ncbi:MAG: tetratricopeptide repeat protein, partial [Vallitaleaceae bacterium]|nr:tetratricopeptide repeat protein [Vallitaleaceae bacterium]